MKKWGIIIFSFIILLVLGACSNGSDTTPTQGSNTASDKGTKESIVLKSTVQAPQASALSKGFDALLDSIEEKSDGRITFERYYGDALVKPADAADAVGAGIADFALIAPSYTPSNNPLSTIDSLPALWVDQWTGTRALLDIFEEFPELRAEFENRNIAVVGAWAMPSYHLITKEDVDSFDDVKGLKLIASGGQALIAEALGSVSVGVTMPESFEAMERGAVDGGLLGFTSSSTYGIHEIAKSVWTIPIGSQGGIFGMNMNKYNELPKDLQQIIKDAAVENAVEFHNIYQVASDEDVAIKKYEEAGVKINVATPEDVEKLKILAEETVWKNWIESPERAGMPAEKILNRFRELVEKYDQQFQANGGPS